MINDYEATEPITSTANPATHSDPPSNEEVISSLNGLIETCKDGQEGFREAAEAVEATEAKRFFVECSQQRAAFVGELQTIVRGLGGDPESSGSTLGAIHRGWMDLKAAIAGNDEHSVLVECERGEDSAKKAYKDALEKGLPANIRSVVENQYNAVLLCHDRVKAFRDATGGKATSSASSGQ